MARKTRKDLAVRHEEVERTNREQRYKRLERNLREAWRTADSAYSSGTLPEVKAYHSAL